METKEEETELKKVGKMMRSLNDFGVPAGILASMFGGNAWMNHLQASVESIQKQAYGVERDVEENKDYISVQAKRLDNIEGKIDTMLALLKSDKK